MTRIGVVIGFFLYPILTAPALAADDPFAVVETATNQVLAKLHEEGPLLAKDPHRAGKLIEEYVLPHFDFDRMSQWVIGKHWKSATPQQRERFTNEFRQLLVRTYAVALTKYRDQQIEYYPPPPANGAKQVNVKIEIVQPGAPSIPMVYRMYQRAGRWMVIDVSVDGVSLVSTYRSTFASDIRRQGLDKVIEDLAARNGGDQTG